MDNEKIPVTNRSEKILKHVLKNPNISFSELQKKFDSLDYMELVLLCSGKYLVCTKPGNRHTMFIGEPFQVDPEDTFWASPKAEEFIEEQSQKKWRWIIPTGISVFAFILSLAAFIVSLLPQVISVRIIP